MIPDSSVDTGNSYLATTIGTSNSVTKWKIMWQWLSLWFSFAFLCFTILEGYGPKQMDEAK